MRTLERIEAKLDRLADLPARVDVVENRLLKIVAVVEALSSKLDHTRTELLLRMDHLRLEFLEAFHLEKAPLYPKSNNSQLQKYCCLPT